MTYLTTPLSVCDRLATHYLLGSIIDSGAKICERFVPSVCSVPENTQKAILQWTKSAGRSEIKDYTSIQCGPWLAALEYLETTKILFARNLHAFVLDITNGKKNIEGLVEKITSEAKIFGDDDLLQQAFKRGVRDILKENSSNNTSGLTYTNLGIYLGKEAVKYSSAGALRLYLFNSFIGNYIPNIPYLYTAVGVSTVALWAIPVVATARSNLTNLKGPKIDKTSELFDQTTKDAIAGKAQEIFVITDSDDAELARFKTALEKITSPPSGTWPFKHVSLPKEQNIEKKETPTVAQESEVPELSQVDVLKERTRLNDLVKTHPEGSLERLKAAIDVREFTVKNAKALKLPEKEVLKRKAQLAEKYAELRKKEELVATAAAAAAASSSSSAPVAKVELSDDDE